MLSVLKSRLSGMTVSLVARRHGVAPNQLFTWRRLVVEGALTPAGSGEQVVLRRGPAPTALNRCDDLSSIRDCS
jgi:transposase-like protein